MSKTIPLTQGKVAIVDNADYEWLTQWKWYAAKTISAYYARRSVWENGKTRDIQMHRVILNAPAKKQVDHINGNGLDNQRVNLRLCTNSQNHMNGKKCLGCSSKYKGVSWHKQTHQWQSFIGINNTQKYLGRFDSEQEAAATYNAEATKLFGQFANLNVI